MAVELAQTVDHALLTLATFGAEGPHTIRDVSERLGVSTTAARRIVITLHRTGMLRRREDGRYDIGPRLIRMTEHLLSRFATMAHPAMIEFARATGRSVILSGFRADSVMVLHQVDPSPFELHIDYRTGYIRDLVDGSDGLVILAHLNAPRRRRLVAESGETGLTDRLRSIRHDGYLIRNNPTWGNMPTLSAPIIDENIGIIGSLTAIGRDLDDGLADAIPAAVAAGKAASEASSALTRAPANGDDA